MTGGKVWHRTFVTLVSGSQPIQMNRFNYIQENGEYKKTECKKRRAHAPASCTQSRALLCIRHFLHQQEMADDEAQPPAPSLTKGAAGFVKQSRQAASKLRTGGCNYGNTFVLGQQLRAHLQPSGMAAVALSGNNAHDRLHATLEYLDAECQKTLAAVSIAWGCMGLAANGRSFPQDRLEKSARRVMKRGGSPYRLSLLGHASIHQK